MGATAASPAPEPQAPITPEPEPVVPQAPKSVPAATGDAPWRNALILSLREAEPKLSIWLDILLADVDVAGPALWERLRFLFESLEAPAAEADAFVAKFADWLAMMEYDEVELFRSELQYRLALALDLEDEEDERNRLFLKLSEGLAKTKEQIVKHIDGLLAAIPSSTKRSGKSWRKSCSWPMWASSPRPSFFRAFATRSASAAPPIRPCSRTSCARNWPRYSRRKRPSGPSTRPK